MKELKLIPPTDVRVKNAIAPFNDEMLKDEGFENRKELADAMFDTMQKSGGIGLTCNQVGLPFNFFVLGGHPEIEKGMRLDCFNPMIISSSEDKVMMKEGCLTYPFVFLNIKRPRKVVVKYEDVDGNLQEGHLDGLMSRIFQHEYDHILGRTFLEHASKLKVDRAFAKAKKEFERWNKNNASVQNT